jgi:replicative DNA helicase
MSRLVSVKHSDYDASFSQKGSLGSEATYKKVPYSKEIEAAVLSAFLFDQNVFVRYSIELSGDDFYLPHHKHIFTALLDVHRKNGLIDIVLLHDSLEFLGVLSVELKEYLLVLQEDVLSVSLVETYVPILKEKSSLRKIIFLANSILSQCYSSSEDLTSSSIIDNAEKNFVDILSQQSSLSYFPLATSVKHVFSSIAESNERGSVTGVIKSGYESLDTIISGFYKGDLIIIAARPSMGKTAFSLCLARNIVAQKGNSVAYVSLEMGADQLAMRILSFDSKVSLHDLKNGTITSDDWLLLTDSAARISHYSIFIDDMPGQTILDVKGRIRKIFLENKISAVIVDYLQLIQGNRKFETRHQEVSEISRSLKQLAKELRVPVIALSQLSRQVESRLDKRPLLSDLRDSGAIEQDADLILFLYRDEVYNKETQFPGIAEIIVGKHRNGPTGVANLRYVKEFTLFENCSSL